MRVVVKPLGMVVLLSVVAGLVILPRLLTGSGKGAVSTTGYEKRTAPSEAGAPIRLQGSASGSSAYNLLAGKSWKFWTENGAVGQYSPLPPGQDGYKQGWRFTIETPGRQIFHAGFNVPLLDLRLSAGEKVALRFAARSEAKAPTCIVLQRNAPPFPPCDKQWIKLTPEWKNYEVVLTSDNYGPGEALLAFMFGETRGIIEIADPILTRSPETGDQKPVERPR